MKYLLGFSLSPVCSVDPTDQKKTACYDIDVEVDDPLKGQMNSFLSSTTNQQEIAALEMKVWPLKQLQIPLLDSQDMGEKHVGRLLAHCRFMRRSSTSTS